METAIFEKNKAIPLLIGFFLITILSFSMVSGAVLSISDANIRSNYFNFDKAWVVSLVSDDYTSDSLTAYLTPKQFKDASGTESKQSLNINVNTKPNYCTYSFKTSAFQYENVYTIEPIKLSKWLWTRSDLEEFQQMILDNCADFSRPNYKPILIEASDGSYSFGDYVYGDSTWVFKANAYCVKINEKIGTIAQPIDKKIIAESDWSVEAEGKPAETKTISNSEAGYSRSTKLGDNVWVQWQGNLGTGEDCPDVSNLVGVHSNAFPEGWQFASRSKYQTYNSYLTSGIKIDIRDYSTSINPDAQATYFKDKANNIIRGAIQKKEDFTFSVLDTSLSSGKVKIDLGRQIVFPLFRLIIDADYLEINIPVGKPQIVSASPVKFTEGLAGVTNVKVKNVGSSRGGFTVRIVDCVQEFSSTTSPIGVTLNAGEERDLSFNIIGSTTGLSGSVSGFCKVEMKESISGESVKKSFSVTMEQIKECDPLTYACGYDEGKEVVKRCNSAGTMYEVVDICEDDEKCKLFVNGEAECIEEGIPPNGNGEICGCWFEVAGKCYIPDIFCWINYYVNKAKIVFSIIAGLLGGLLGMSYTNKFMPKAKQGSLKKYRWLILLATFLILGGAISFIAFTYFWWIVLALILLGIIKLVVPIL